jgi:hypothetical protein
MTLMATLRSLFGRRVSPQRPPCQMTEPEVLEIARAALAGSGPLIVHDVVRTDGRVEWRVGTATIGTGKLICIDDADGRVTGHTHWGVR